MAQDPIGRCLHALAGRALGPPHPHLKSSNWSHINHTLWCSVRLCRVAAAASVGAGDGAVFVSSREITRKITGNVPVAIAIWC